MPKIIIPKLGGGKITVQYPLGKELDGTPVFDVVSNEVTVKFKNHPGETSAKQSKLSHDLYVVPTNASFLSLQVYLSSSIEVEYITSSDGKKLAAETGLLKSLDDTTITISDEGPSAVNEYGDGMGGTNTIPIENIISFRKAPESK